MMETIISYFRRENVTVEIEIAGDKKFILIKARPVGTTF